jgi:hypothetical protein
MALASLLMGAGGDRPGWFDVGASFIVVDTLVHNFLTALERVDSRTRPVSTGRIGKTDAVDFAGF